MTQTHSTTKERISTFNKNWKKTNRWYRQGSVTKGNGAWCKHDITWKETLYCPTTWYFTKALYDILSKCRCTCLQRKTGKLWSSFYCNAGVGVYCFRSGKDQVRAMVTWCSCWLCKEAGKIWICPFDKDLI